ncbi:hypothetical protein FIBSPDRAFT_875674 [Athelia psychrophila]|uniref:Uncharacterized protein n=1 Tax=Athelia psychrophila TaxID=1759441 RepID=A0A167XJ92_9AGAM|nr:hypothetical protein FIBSPDRAFT_875674 [Fibularhizoctonia sp. CBS 109695]
MGKWSQYDEDSHRLPEGVIRTGYDADTKKYTFHDKATGQRYQSGARQRYGTLEPVDASSTPAGAADAYCESWEEVLDWEDSTSCTAKATADCKSCGDVLLTSLVSFFSICLPQIPRLPTTQGRYPSSKEK